MSLSYCVGLVYNRHAVLVVRGVELSNDVEVDDALQLVKVSVKHLESGRIVANPWSSSSSIVCCWAVHMRVHRSSVAPHGHHRVLLLNPHPLCKHPAN